MNKIRKPLAVLITDTHKKDNNIELVEDIFKQCLKLCLKLKVKYCVHLGDWFTDRSKQTLGCLISTRKVIKDFEHNNIEILTIQGNHDKCDQRVDDGYISIYENNKFCHYEKEGYQIIQDICFCFLPFFTESDEYVVRLVNLIESIEDIELPKILFTHCSVSGVRNNDGSVVDNGIEPNYFNIFDEVFVGHYHNKSDIGENIHYIGSAYQGNFGENEDKGFTIVYNDLTFEYVKSKFPKFIQIKIPIENKQEIEETFAKYKDSPDKIRITLVGNKDTQKAFKEVYSETGLDVKFENVSEAISIDVEALKTTNVVSLNKKEFIKYWILYSNAVDDKSMRKEGMELLKQL